MPENHAVMSAETRPDSELSRDIYADDLVCRTVNSMAPLGVV
jgi:hypothetical protein